MAQNLVLNVLARDKTKAALGSVQKGLSNLRASIFSVQSLTLIAEVKLAEATYKSYEIFPI